MCEKISAFGDAALQSDSTSRGSTLIGPVLEGIVLAVSECGVSGNRTTEQLGDTKRAEKFASDLKKFQAKGNETRKESNTWQRDAVKGIYAAQERFIEKEDARKATTESVTIGATASSGVAGGLTASDIKVLTGTLSRLSTQGRQTLNQVTIDNSPDKRQNVPLEREIILPSFLSKSQVKALASGVGR